MKPFRIFFGIAIGIILFFFVAKIFLFAFFAAAIMSIIYAVYRRVRNFITYDKNGEYYINSNNYYPRFQNNNDEVEPLFFENTSKRHRKINNIQFIEAI